MIYLLKGLEEVSGALRCCEWLQDTIELAYKGHTYHLDDILVDKFCPSDLIAPGTAPLLLEQQHNAVALSKSAQESLRQKPELQVRLSPGTHLSRTIPV